MIEINIEMIPLDLYEQWSEEGIIQSCDDLSDNVLENIEKQLKPFRLEIVWWENGSAIEWMVKKKERGFIG